MFTTPTPGVLAAFFAVNSITHFLCLTTLDQSTIKTSSINFGGNDQSLKVPLMVSYWFFLYSPKMFFLDKVTRDFCQPQGTTLAFGVCLLPYYHQTRHAITIWFSALNQYCLRASLEVYKRHRASLLHMKVRLVSETFVRLTCQRNVVLQYSTTELSFIFPTQIYSRITSQHIMDNGGVQTHSSINP